MRQLENRAVDLLWSLWTELGVPGTVRHHQQLLMDPEPLIVFTPSLAATDPRLMELVFDWCRTNAALISKQRIAAIAKTSPEGVTGALERFNGALALHGVKWLPAGSPESFTPERQKMSPSFERTALLRLRMRCLAGVSIRAEVLTMLLCSEGKPVSVDELTVSGVSRRSVERVVEELIESRFLTVQGKTRGRRFQLAGRQAFVTFIQENRSIELPKPVNWHLVFDSICLLNSMAQSDLSESLQRIEAVKLRGELAERMVALNQPIPPVLSGKQDAADQIITWGHERITDWCEGRL